MKILLVSPPENHMITANIPEFVDKGMGVYPPLGLLTVAASILEGTHWTVEILDCKAESVEYEVLSNRIKDFSPDVVGIQTLTFTLIDVIKVTKIIRECDSSIHILLGGPHVNLYPHETLSIPSVDSILLGEGELSICNFLKAIEKGEDYSAVKGIGTRMKDRIVINPQTEYVENLDLVPFPARQLVDVKKYFAVLSEQNPITTMMSSRGCPFQCIYCDRPHLGKKFRARSPESVVREMQECVSLGIREIFFYDDTFTINKKRVLAICDLLIKKKISIGWDVRAHVNTVDEEMLSKMAEAGCRRIHFGVETGTMAMQKILRKNLDLNHVKKVFELAHRQNIQTLAYFMIGCPAETAEQIAETKRYMLSLKANYVHISVLTPFPGTDLYREALERKIIVSDIWKEFAQNPTENFIPQFWEEIFSKEELFEKLIDMYKAFYFRPSRLFKELCTIRSLDDVRTKTSVGWRMIFKKS